MLCENFKLTTRVRVIQILDIFFNTRFIPGENLRLFLCRVNESAECLCDVCHQLQPFYLGYQIIRSLPNEFESTVWLSDNKEHSFRFRLSFSETFLIHINSFAASMRVTYSASIVERLIHLCLKVFQEISDPSKNKIKSPMETQSS